METQAVPIRNSPDGSPGFVVVRLDVEINGEWQTLRGFDNYLQAADLARDLTNAGVSAMLSCACGSYEFGGCEPCAASLAEGTR